jgi:hypothetical protein
MILPSSTIAEHLVIKTNQWSPVQPITQPTSPVKREIGMVFLLHENIKRIMQLDPVSE